MGVGHRPMSDCLEKVLRRVRLTHQSTTGIGGQCPPIHIYLGPDAAKKGADVQVHYRFFADS